MPCSRQITLTDLLDSCICKMETICASKKFFRFIFKPFKLGNLSKDKRLKYGGGYQGDYLREGLSTVYN